MSLITMISAGILPQIWESDPKAGNSKMEVNRNGW